jgi:hypothetical protein
MSDGPDLTFDPDGFVRMDDLPDTDPDAALPPDELTRLQAMMHGDAVPTGIEAGWDAMVADIDRIDFGDSLALVPDDGADPDGDGPAGPIVLVDDDAAGGSSGEFEPEAIGRPDSTSTTSARDAIPDEPHPTTDSPGWTSDEALDGSDSSWATDDVHTVADDEHLTPDPGELDAIDLLDVDVVELHHDDGDLPGPTP